MFNILKHFIFFTLFFILFFIETKYIGGVRIAILWKVVLLGIIIVYIVLNSKEKIKSFIVFGYLYSFKNIISYSSLDYIISTVAEVLKSLYIPLFAHFFILLNKLKNFDVYKFLLVLSIYIIISCVPFLVGIIESPNEGYDMSRFGLKGFGFVGIFENAHYASNTLAFCITILIYQIQTVKLSSILKVFYILLIIVALIALVKTYARLGYAMLFVSACYLLLANKSFKFYLKLIIPVSILIVSFIVVYNQSKLLQMRISGENKYSKASLGSGRGDFAIHALDNWYSEDLDTFFVGMGKEYAMDQMEKDVGLRIYAHNGFIDVLQINGVIGAAIFLLFFIYLIKYIKINKHHPYYQLSFSIFLGYVISMLVQGERFFLSDLILAASIALLSIETKKKVK